MSSNSPSIWLCSTFYAPQTLRARSPFLIVPNVCANHQIRKTHHLNRTSRTLPYEPSFVLCLTTVSLCSRNCGSLSGEWEREGTANVHPEVGVSRERFLGLSRQFSRLPSSAGTCGVGSPTARPHLSSTASDDLFTTLRPPSINTSPTLYSAPRTPGSSSLGTQHRHRNLPRGTFTTCYSSLPDRRRGTPRFRRRDASSVNRNPMLGIQDVEILPSWPGNTFNKREATEAANFELADCWDEGEPLGGSQEWPVYVAQNLRFHGMT